MTFTSYNKAAVKVNTYDELGIRVDGNLVAIDVCHCIKDECLNDIAKEIVNHFPNSYIEFSPSGKSLRIFTFLSKSIIYNKDLYKLKTKEVEVYIAGFTNRFVTITGHVCQEYKIVEESEEPLWILEKYPTSDLKKLLNPMMKKKIFFKKNS